MSSSCHAPFTRLPLFFLSYTSKCVEVKIVSTVLYSMYSSELFNDTLSINTFKYHVFAPMGRFQLESKLILTLSIVLY